MTYRQKLEEVFPCKNTRKILAGEDGIFAWYNYLSNLESAIYEGDLVKAQRYYNQNHDDFKAYKQAYKIYKQYPGQKRLQPIRNSWADCNVIWEGNTLSFPVPYNISVEVFLLKASRIFAHWEQRIEKAKNVRGAQCPE